MHGYAIYKGDFMTCMRVFPLRETACNFRDIYFPNCDVVPVHVVREEI